MRHRRTRRPLPLSQQPSPLAGKAGAAELASRCDSSSRMRLSSSSLSASSLSSYPAIASLLLPQQPSISLPPDTSLPGRQPNTSLPGRLRVCLDECIVVLYRMVQKICMFTCLVQRMKPIGSELNSSIG